MLSLLAEISYKLKNEITSTQENNYILQKKWSRRLKGPFKKFQQSIAPFNLACLLSNPLNNLISHIAIILDQTIATFQSVKESNPLIHLKHFCSQFNWVFSVTSENNSLMFNGFYRRMTSCIWNWRGKKCVKSMFYISCCVLSKRIVDVHVHIYNAK